MSATACTAPTARRSSTPMAGVSTPGTGCASLVLVHVTNATPEPDGSQRSFFLRVPPDMQRARQAVAWTFGKSEREYAPVRES
jgi:hypothetical protein